MGVVRLFARRADAAVAVGLLDDAEWRVEPGHLIVTGEERFQVLPKVGVLRQKLSSVGLTALFERLDVGQEDVVPPLFSIAIGGQFMIHGPTPPGRAAARAAASTRGIAGRRLPAGCGRSAPPRRPP